jgi:hypothetical protein
MHLLIMQVILATSSCFSYSAMQLFSEVQLQPHQIDAMYGMMRVFMGNPVTLNREGNHLVLFVFAREPRNFEMC